jgi:hypothetical protein
VDQDLSRILFGGLICGSLLLLFWILAERLVGERKCLSVWQIQRCATQLPLPVRLPVPLQGLGWAESLRSWAFSGWALANGGARQWKRAKKMRFSHLLWAPHRLSQAYTLVRSPIPTYSSFSSFDAITLLAPYPLPQKEFACLMLPQHQLLREPNLQRWLILNNILNITYGEWKEGGPFCDPKLVLETCLSLYILP